MKQLLMCRHH